MIALNLYVAERLGAEWKICNKGDAGSQDLKSKPLGTECSYADTVVEATNAETLGIKCPQVDTVDQIL